MLRELTKEDFPMLYAVLEESFPPDELRTREGQEALFDDPRYRVFSLEGRAFCCTWELGSRLFIEHLAVDPACRSQGLGSRLMRGLPGRELCLEVEPPDSGLRLRRINFYRRLGFRLNGYDYVQPPLRRGGGSPPLRIMTYPSPIDYGEFCALRGLLYKEIYRVPG